MKFGEYGLVLAEASVEYLHELFYGDHITISLSIEEIGRASFECMYVVEVKRSDKKMMAAKLSTKMVCFDYTERKIKSIPDHLKKTLQQCANGELKLSVPNLP